MLTNFKAVLRCSLFKSNGFQVCAKPAAMGIAGRFFSPPGRQAVKNRQRPSDTLAQALKNEYAFEKERYEAYEEGAEFIKEAGFKVIESRGNSEIKLVRNVDDKIVEISYQASETLSDLEDEPELDENKEANEEKIEKKPASRAEFFIAVKGKDGSGLLFSCSSENADFQIFDITHSKNIDSLLKESGKNDSSYIGPSFDHLDEKVQNAFYDYLISLGINDNLLTYIENSSVDKNKRLYMNWLQDLRGFMTEENTKSIS